MMAVGDTEVAGIILRVVLTMWLTLAGVTWMAGMCYAVYFLFSLPLRRQERARLFLDLVATALAQVRQLAS